MPTPTHRIDFALVASTGVLARQLLAARHTTESIRCHPERGPNGPDAEARHGSDCGAKLG